MLIPLSRFNLQCLAMASSSLLLFSLPDAKALSINANLTNLADAVVGQDLWNASFTLSGGVFQANEGFTIYFNPLDYSNISPPLLPVPTGWDVLAIQPDPLLNAPGFLDGLALNNSPSLSQPFAVNFVWRGAGDPGSQPFETYRLTGGFTITGTGQTIVGAGPVIPEPGTIFWALGVFGFLSVPVRRRPIRV